jgi:PAS domain S-box-containing protein
VLAGASANADAFLGASLRHAVGQPLESLAPTLADAVQAALASLAGQEPVPLRMEGPPGRPTWQGAVHRSADGTIVAELERCDDPVTASLPRDKLLDITSAAVQQIGQAASLGVMAHATARHVRDMTGYDRVMVYKFDADGHGEIIAEARDPRLDSLLGHHYPASDIPQRARELYLRNRVRVLVDVNYEPQPLIGADGRPVGEALDMSMCFLRSMSPLHLQYLRNMGVTATLVVSLLHEGRLWGLIAAHHDSPRNVSHALRTACDLLAEVVSTRIAAIENYAHVQVAVLVRRLEQRLVEATSTEGDWRLALFRNPRTLLQPLDATGAALFVEDEVLTAGEVPSTPELRALQQWVAAQTVDDPLYATSALSKAHPPLESLAPTASGVMAMRLSTERPDALMWFRREQLRTVTWAGDPHKPMVGDDPTQLSPRRSFAAWSELVRGTALPWTTADLALGRAFGHALVDIIVQVHAVRLLVAEQQLATIRQTVRRAAEAVVIADPSGVLVFCNDAARRLIGCDATVVGNLDAMAAMCAPPEVLRKALAALRGGQSAWRGEVQLRRLGGEAVPVALRIESVPGRAGRPLGYVVALFDQSANRRASEARAHLEASLRRSTRHDAATALLPGGAAADADGVEPLLGAILTNASLAAMDIADASSTNAAAAPMLEALESSTQRATALVERIRAMASS